MLFALYAGASFEQFARAHPIGESHCGRKFVILRERDALMDIAS